MCGRAACTLAPASIERRYQPKNGFRNANNFTPSYNISPFGTSCLPVMTRYEDSSSHELNTDVAAMRWGLIPVWQKDNNLKSTDVKLFNARLETVKEKKMFKRLIGSKRCVVLLDGFFEWTQEGSKQPYFFRFNNGEPLTLAGIMDVWHNGSGDQIESFTIITTDSPKLFSNIHNRMPAIVNGENMDKWLNPSTTVDSALQCLSDPLNIKRLQWYPVTKAVGNVAYNMPDCTQDLKSAKLPSSSSKANMNITKFFKPAPNSPSSSPSSPPISRVSCSPTSSPIKSHYFSKTPATTQTTITTTPSSLTTTITTTPSTHSPPRDFDKEVGDFPLELLDIPDDLLVAQSIQNNATNTNNVNTNNTIVTPSHTLNPQTVPSPPQKQKEIILVDTDEENIDASPTAHSSSFSPDEKSIFGKTTKRKLDFEPVVDAKKHRS